MKRLCERCALWLCGLAALTGVGSLTAAPTASEVQVKAAFIYHFTEFVDWPAHTFAQAKSPFVIGLMGGTALNEALVKMVRGEAMDGHPIEVRQLHRRLEATDCQIVVVAREEEDLFRSAQLRDLPVLTVGETDDFLRSGGIIAFVNDGNRVKLRINLTAAQAASLQISSKLLRVAQVLPAP